MHEMTIQDQAADAIHALNDQDAGVILSLVNRLLELCNDDDEPLTEEELAAFDEAYEHRNDPDYWISAEDLHKELEACE